MKRKLIQIWLNPSWKPWGLFRGYPDGFIIRFGRVVVKFLGRKL